MIVNGWSQIRFKQKEKRSSNVCFLSTHIIFSRVFIKLRWQFTFLICKGCWLRANSNLLVIKAWHESKMWCAPKHERTRKTQFFYFWQCWKIIHKRAPLLRAIQTFDLTSRNRDMRFENGAHFISAYKHPELFFGYSSEKRITCGAQSSFSFQRCNEDLYFFRDMLRALKFGRSSGRAFYNCALSDRQNLETWLKFWARALNKWMFIIQFQIVKYDSARFHASARWCAGSPKFRCAITSLAFKINNRWNWSARKNVSFSESE